MRLAAYCRVRLIELDFQQQRIVTMSEDLCAAASALFSPPPSLPAFWMHCFADAIAGFLEVGPDALDGARMNSPGSATFSARRITSLSG